MMLSHDPNPDVRFMLASASYVPKKVLNDLCLDDNPYVQMRACETLSKLAMGKK
jgi:hypothetical protein